MRNIRYILGAMFFVAMLGIGLWSVYKNHAAQQTELQEKYIQTEAEIIYVGRTGTGYHTKALLRVNYRYNDINYSGTITRTFQKDGYYQKGNRITINLNPNNPKDIR